MDIPIIGSTHAQPAKVEVCRSFSRKLNLANYGGAQYESADFFASRKIECSSEDATWVSNAIDEECVTEVRDAMAAYIAEMKHRGAERARKVG